MMDCGNFLIKHLFLSMSEAVFTVPISSVHGLLRGALSSGASTVWLHAMLRQAGIVPALLDQAQGRVTVAQFVALFSAVKDSLDDECLGFLHGRAMRCGSFALMVRATLGAHTLESALQRLSRAFALLQDDVTLAPAVQGARYGVTLRMRPSHSNPSLSAQRRAASCWQSTYISMRRQRAAPNVACITRCRVLKRASASSENIAQTCARS